MCDGKFDYGLFVSIYQVVRAMDNIVDRTTYPARAGAEAKNKRDGLGVTGLANAGEMCGLPYASEQFMEFTRLCLMFGDHCYSASADCRREGFVPSKGRIPLYAHVH